VAASAATPPGARALSEWSKMADASSSAAAVAGADVHCFGGAAAGGSGCAISLSAGGAAVGGVGGSGGAEAALAAAARRCLTRRVSACTWASMDRTCSSLHSARQRSRERGSSDGTAASGARHSRIIIRCSRGKAVLFIQHRGERRHSGGAGRYLCSHSLSAC